MNRIDVTTARLIVEKLEELAEPFIRQHSEHGLIIRNEVSAPALHTQFVEELTCSCGESERVKVVIR